MEAFAPPPTVGLPVARSGGQSTAHPPVQVLFMPASRWNRYSVRPCESTRILPSFSLATPTVAGRPFAVFGGAEEPFELLPHAATATATSTAVAPARKVMDLVRVMLAPFVGCERVTEGASSRTAALASRSPPGRSLACSLAVLSQVSAR